MSLFGLLKKSTPSASRIFRTKWEPAGKVSARQAILDSWCKLPAVFSSRHVSGLASRVSGVNYMDTTITSKMRLLRKQGKIGFRCVDKQKSQYEKLF